MKSFPKPLTAAMEQEYLVKKDEGDRRARDILIERNLRLVAHIVKKYNAGTERTEDLLSIGTIGLIKAIDTFQGNRGIRLATYASRCIENELLMTLRADKKQSRDIYLYDPIGADREGNEISLLDILETDHGEMADDIIEKMEMSEMKEHLYRFMEQELDEREREILYMRYGIKRKKALTQKEVGLKLGISRSYVSRIEKKAVRKLKDAFCKNSALTC